MIRTAAASLLLGTLLASCQAPLKLLLAPEAADLKPLIEKALAQTPHAAMSVEVLTATLEAVKPPALHNVLVLSSAPTLDLPEGSDPVTPQASGWDNSTYSALPALAALGRGTDGQWNRIPVFFDVVGRTTFVSHEGETTGPAHWPLVVASTAPDSFVVAGSRPALRQAAFRLQNLLEPSQTPDGWKNALGGVSAWVQLRGWRHDTWKYATADLLNLYRPGSAPQFIETYRDFEKANPAGFRRFAVITAGTPPFAVAGIVLFLEWHGDASRAEQAGAAARALNSVEFLKDAGTQTKWLAANQRAYEIDPTGASVRQAVLQAQRFLAVTDRLPQPLVENDPLVQIQLAVDRTH